MPLQSAAASPAQAKPQCLPAAYEFDGLDQWLLQNLWVEDPIDVRRRDLIGWFITANCTILDLRYSCEASQWEVRFTCAAEELVTPTQVEALLCRVARGCRCGIEQLVAIVVDNEVSARFRLRAGHVG
jgi:hypothetical protein